MPTFEYVDGYLATGNDLSSGSMTMVEAKAAASAKNAIGFTWKGEKNPKGKFGLYVKNSRCLKLVSKGHGWHTMLKKAEPKFKYVTGYLPGGNDLLSGAMTLEEAKAKASTKNAIGFTWRGDKNSKGKVNIYVKSSRCSKVVSKGQGWHTMLKTGVVAGPPAQTSGKFDMRYNFTLTFLNGVKKTLADVVKGGKPVLLYQYNAF